ncbi:MAG: hypothetical protein ACTSRI_14315 [Promethearchaeota archaeon]
MEEINKIKNNDKKNAIILSYAKEDSFKQYYLKILAASRIGHIKDYSKLTFSIDPGAKQIGLVVFLDDYFLNSHTIHDPKNVIKKIKEYVNAFQNKNSNFTHLIFKFGGGIPQMTIDLVKEICNIYKNKNKKKFYLIDEAKSSKIKIYDNEKKISMPKHEASALILALRDGMEINQDNYSKIFKQFKFNKLKEEDFNKEISKKSNRMILTTHEIMQKVLSGKLSLSESSEMLNYHCLKAMDS